MPRSGKVKVRDRVSPIPKITIEGADLPRSEITTILVLRLKSSTDKLETNQKLILAFYNKNRKISRTEFVFLFVSSEELKLVFTK